MKVSVWVEESGASRERMCELVLHGYRRVTKGEMLETLFIGITFRGESFPFRQEREHPNGMLLWSKPIRQLK